MVIHLPSDGRDQRTSKQGQPPISRSKIGVDLDRGAASVQAGQAWLLRAQWLGKSTDRNLGDQSSVGRDL